MRSFYAPEEEDDVSPPPPDVIDAPDEAPVAPVDVARPAMPAASSPTAPPRAPLAPVPPSVDQELLAAHAARRQALQRNNFGRGMDEIIQAVAGAKGKPSTAYWDDADKQAGQGVADLKEQRTANSALAAKDPNSPESAKAREAVIGIMGQEYVDRLKKMGVWDSITKEDVDSGKIFNALQLREAADTRRTTAAATLAERQRLAADKKDHEGQDSAALGDVLKRQYADKLKSAYGDDAPAFVDGLSLEGKRQLLKDLQSGRAAEAQGDRQLTQQQFQAQENEKNRQNHLATANIAATTRTGAQDIARERLGLQKDRGTVAGYEVDPERGHPLQLSQAKELQEAVSARENIDTKAKQALEILAKHKGVPLDPSSDDTARLRLLMGEMLPLLTTSSGMKSFTEGHAHVFTDAMGSPQSLLNFINSGRLATQLQTLQHSSHEAVDSMAHSMGQRPAQRQPGVGGSGPAAAGDVVRVAPKGHPEKAKAFTRAQAQKFLADPRFEEVK